MVALPAGFTACQLCQSALELIPHVQTFHPAHTL
jgi:hypothetical protein